MLSQAGRYAMRGRASYRRLLGGTLLVVGAVTIVPLLALVGYWYRVLEYPDSRAPPTLSPLHRNLAHGLYALAAVASLWLPAVGVGAFSLSFAYLAGGPWLVGAGTLAGVVAFVLVYVTPAVVALHARGIGLVTGIKRGDLRLVLLRSPYAHAVIVSAGIAAVVGGLAAALLWPAVLLVTSARLNLGVLFLQLPDIGLAADVLLLAAAAVTTGVVVFLSLVTTARLCARGVAAAAGDRLPSTNSRVIGLSARPPAGSDRQ